MRGTRRQQFLQPCTRVDAEQVSLLFCFLPVRLRSPLARDGPSSPRLLSTTVHIMAATATAAIGKTHEQRAGNAAFRFPRGPWPERAGFGLGFQGGDP